MIVARPKQNEPDLLAGNELCNLIISDLNGLVVETVHPPADGWTHDKLEAVSYDTICPYGWDAYLGNKDNWVGSSEV